MIFTTVPILFIIHILLVNGFYLNSNEFAKNNITIIKKGNSSKPLENFINIKNNDSSNSNNNNNEIEDENNWRTKEISEISQSKRNENLKQNHPSIRWWKENQTIPDQFYDYVEKSRHLKEIELEKIATRRNKKLDNTFPFVVNNKGRFGRVNDDESTTIKDLREKSNFSDYENVLSNDDVFETNEKQYPMKKKFTTRKNYAEQTQVEIFRSKRRATPYVSGISEEKDIQNIKQEVSKLEDLIQVLHDQQSILSLLDQIENNVNLTDGNLKHTKSIQKLNENTDERYIKNLSKNVTVLEKEFEVMNSMIKNMVKDLNNESVVRENMINYLEDKLKEQNENVKNMKEMIFTELEKIKDKQPHSEQIDKNNEIDLNNVLKQLKSVEDNITNLLNENHRSVNDEEFNARSSNDDFITSSKNPSTNLKSSTSSMTSKDLESLLANFRKKSKNDTTKKKLRQFLVELDESDSGEPTDSLFEDSDINAVNESSDDDSLQTLTDLIKILIQDSDTIPKKTKIKQQKLNNNKLKRMLKLLQNSGESKTNSNNEILFANLKELSEEIDKLRPKDDDKNSEDENNSIMESLVKTLIAQKTPQAHTTQQSAKLTNDQLLMAITELLSNNKTSESIAEDKNEKKFNCTKVTCELSNCDTLVTDGDESFKNDGYPPHINENFQSSSKLNSMYTPYKQYIPYPNDYNQNYNFFQPNPMPNYPFQTQQENPFRNTPGLQKSSQNFDYTYPLQYPINPQENYELGENDAQLKIDDLAQQINDLKDIIDNLSISNDKGTIARKADSAVYGNKDKIDANDTKDSQYGKSNENVFGESKDGVPSTSKPSLLRISQKSNIIPYNPLNPLQVPHLDKYNPIIKSTNEEKEVDHLHNEESSERKKRSTDENNSQLLSNLLVKLLEDASDDTETSEDLDKETSPSARSSLDKKFAKIRTKKLNIFDKFFDKILDKIVDKVELAIIKLTERFFGIDSSIKKGYSNYGNQYGNDVYQFPGNIIQIFQNFGIKGLFPLIILKSCYTIASIFYSLQSVPFIKNFLIPGGVVAIVSGLIVFLIYFLQPNYNTQYTNYQTPYNHYETSFKYPNNQPYKSSYSNNNNNGYYNRYNSGYRSNVAPNQNNYISNYKNSNQEIPQNSYQNNYKISGNGYRNGYDIFRSNVYPNLPYF